MSSTPRSKARAGTAASHAALAAYSLLVLIPLSLVVVNSLKNRSGIFGSPFAPPTPETFDLSGYQRVLGGSGGPLIPYLNSAIVTAAAILLTLALGSLAAFALSNARFPRRRQLTLYFVIGIMIPIRIGTVTIVELMGTFGVIGQLSSLVLIFTATSLPLAIFLLVQYFEEIPAEIGEAAQIDGASPFRIYLISLPLVAPGMAVVLVLTMLPIWNDLWWPLVLTPRSQTVVLWAQQFLGQYQADWSATFAALTISALPLVIVYLFASRRLGTGLFSGAVR